MQKAIPEGTPPAAQRLVGLDYLRVLAVGLVAIQHGLSVLDRLDDTQIVFNLNYGQVGVAIFLAVSGFLAAINPSTPLTWLWRRLMQIYPAYWVAMLISFFLTWVSGYKTFDTYQVV